MDDPDADIKNPTGSVFCAHGSGFYVPWYEVKDYMHLEAAVDMGGDDGIFSIPFSAASLL